MDVEALAARVSADVHAAVVKHYEDAEHAGLIVGNGHHMAQQIADAAKALLLERHEAHRQAVARKRALERLAQPPDIKNT